MNKPMMGCGHAANATDGNGKPSCAICIGIHTKASTIVESPDLSDRKARCSYYGSVPEGRLHESNYGCFRGEKCMCEVPSSTDLPFFSHNPLNQYDQMYCGCWGWD